MDNLKTLYTSFDGRIGRKTFWLSVLGIIIASIILAVIVTPLLGGASFGMFSLMNSNISAETFAQRMLEINMRTGWANLIVYAIMFVPITAIILKRRHDRGSAGREYWAYAALSVAILLLQATGLGFSIIDVAGIRMPAPNLIAMSLTFLSGIVGLFLLIVCGFLKGQEGENSYGPNPLT